MCGWDYVVSNDLRVLVGQSNMFGVVLWSDRNDRKAVFWCEDQGDLAFFDGAIHECEGVFDAGDMVHFDVSLENKIRRASNAQLIEQQVCTELPQALRRDASANQTQSSKVVPFDAKRNRLRIGKTKIRRKA